MVFGNLLSRKEPVGVRRYYHFDGLGSTTALSGESGATVATLLYDAWGNQRAATGATVPNYRFTGAELDTASGFYHMGARFYDPTIGRWLSEDPIQDRYFAPQSLNFYVYVSSNAATYRDPSGMEEETSSSGGGQSEAAKALAAIINLLVDLEYLADFLASRGIYIPIPSPQRLQQIQKAVSQARARGYRDYNFTLPLGGFWNATGGFIETATGDIYTRSGLRLGVPSDAAFSKLAMDGLFRLIGDCH